MLRAPVMTEDFCGDIFETQRRLRSQILDRAIIRHPSARDLAAHMLLRLDDLPNCWSIATSWLRAELGCHRVDSGFGTPEARDYFPGIAEAKNSDYDIPSFGGTAVYNQDRIMQEMWLGSRPVIFSDIKQDRRVSKRLRQRLSGARTKSKFGGALRTRNGSYGLICADWTEHFAPNKSDLYDCFEQTVFDVLSPIIAIAKEIAELKHARQNYCASTSVDISDNNFLERFTQTEIEIAKLVVRGLSYKEIARIRGRSFSTIDHQLRSIRQKAEVSSTPALVSLLAKFKAFEN